MKHGSSPMSPDWRWRTFPVLFAFFVGLLAASLVNREINTVLEAVVTWIALLGVGYGLAHLVLRNVIVAGRMRRRERAATRGETTTEDWEDEIVHPDGTAT